MAERTLNNRQVEVLEWIAQGCPDGVMEGYSHKTTAVALKGRRLIQIEKTRDSWGATLTDAGTYFLEHGAYPEGHWPTYGPPRPARPTAPPKARPERRVTAVRPVDQLISDVVAAGGELQISGREAARYKSLVSSATRFGKVPEGKLLKVESGRRWEEQFVRLTDKPEWMTAVLQPIRVAEKLSKPHPAISDLRDSGFKPRSDVRSRTFRILDAVAREAERRGYRVKASVWQGGERRSKGVLTIEIVGHEGYLDIDELDDRVPHVATATELRDAERYSWKRIPTHDLVPSGRLRIRVLNGWAVRQDAFSDTKTIDLVDRLPHVLQEIELRAHNAELRRIEQERRAAERRAQWERVVEKAKQAVRDDELGKVLRDQIDRWEQAKQIDEYLAAMTDRVADRSDQERSDVEAWLEWARNYRARLEPLSGTLRLPAEREFTAAELAPVMPRDWSPYGP
ncbi:hypothetical protein [Aeromicrobium fastidiosum]|uniref:PE-PGRS family protein n=1 Tax=Aeromicrobium fastidiosum TaxID=52699 RepID=A0A641AME0_9ACTN|nr:hypothetical protein [Aeromicrobium fastidiosum]KAA1375972.1 hypothetical protein ESP62_010945 [Aeromicrobium fastidiosum]MBP2392168.1 hypothetical protein [Aeromicrobium fastidiosum]